tara:strand:+ start:57 stop:386 length:330 start_codon:yes stop_codon:yes gene_type:complete
MNFNIFKKNKLLCCFILLILTFLALEICKSLKKKEGIVFTDFDNEKFFTKPWNEFCMFQPPSCRKDFLEKPGMIGVFPIGCNCQGVGEATNPPGLPENCYQKEAEYLYK